MPHLTGAPARPEPIDIAYRHGQILKSGAHFVVLPTLEALETHWEEFKLALPFIAQGNCPGERPLYLRPCEWIFAPTRAALVQAVMRWDQIGIEPKWFDWRSLKPEEFEYYFSERETTRQRSIEENAWTDRDEQSYVTAIKRKNRGNYHGWWRLEKLPYGETHETWFSGLLEEPSDATMSIGNLNELFQTHTYIEWRHQSIDEVIFLDATDMKEELEYWRGETAAGRSGYGED